MKRIAIIGSGVVGVATGKGFLAKGHDVIFCDINPEVVSNLSKDGFRTAFPEDLKTENIDAFFLSVSTPTINDRIDLTFFLSAVAALGRKLSTKNGYFLLVIRSTVPPGTTEEIIIPLFEKYSHLKAGRDFGVCMNPEFLREKTAEDDFKNPWAVVIGSLDQRSQKFLEEIYGSIESNYFPVSIREAEMAKYVHNIFNALKISYFNEMRRASQLMGIDAEKVFKIVVKSAEGIWNPEYGTKNKGPFGGSCLPKDTKAFLTFTKELGLRMPLLRAIIKVNSDFEESLNHR